jgi:hypothetical protein
LGEHRTGPDYTNLDEQLLLRRRISK